MTIQHFTRNIASTIARISKSYSAVFLIGPRQVGKTTVLDDLKTPERGYVTLDDPMERNLAKTDPRLFLQMHPAPVLIDEVQYAPELFSYLKMEVDQGAAPGAYWLTGSQSFQMMRLAQESLAGRAAILHMAGLSQHEIFGQGDAKPLALDLVSLKEAEKQGKSTDLSGIYKRIWQGGMPGFVSGKYPDRDVFYASYLQTYLDRDLADLAPEVDKHRFFEFLQAAACRCGCLLNAATIAQDVGVSTVAVKYWLSLLEKSDVIFYLHPYSNNLLKRTVKAPKLYFFDTGLVAYLTRHNSPETLSAGAISGQILENYVVNQIRAGYRNLGKECPLWYYRDFDQSEIDLMIEADGVFHPIEVKRTTSPERSMVKSFDKLRKKGLNLGTGALICNAPQLSAFDAQTFVVPVWTL